MITFFNISGAMIYLDDAGRQIGYEDVFTKIEMCRTHYAEWVSAPTTSTSSCAGVATCLRDRRAVSARKGVRMPWGGILAVGGGAAIGAWLRWGLGVMLNPVFPTLPLGTLAANLDRRTADGLRDGDPDAPRR